MKLNELLDTLKKQGLSKNKSDSDFNPIELEIGVAVEKEHVDSINSRKEISKDHLSENPFYYTKVLAKAEPDVMVKAEKIVKKHGFKSVKDYLENYKAE